MVSGATPGVPDATGTSVPSERASLRSTSSWEGATPAGIPVPMPTATPVVTGVEGEADATGEKAGGDEADEADSRNDDVDLVRLRVRKANEVRRCLLRLSAKVVFVPGAT
ncbi:hypothetical protein QP932_11910 [Corynebacterium freneyi]|uniref:hypothetical protein n=1 Tax=Corynebacterium freneyi TaxID=134034 RepID=UPI00254CFAF2|nr:hypothetical protein [Corynebacterium freneyi]MDK8769190.1 hypothetical protein [Corynebacterium freneyi]